MSDWIFIINNENWKIVRDKEIMGFSSKKKNMFNKIKSKDRCVVYVSGKKGFAGTFDILNKMNNTKIRWNTGSFPNLIKLKTIAIPKQPLEIKSLINKLQFITKPKHWSLFVRSARQIPKSDIDLLINEMIDKK